MWRRGASCIVVALVAAGLAGCSENDANPSAASSRVPVVVDTDVGADDAIALLSLLSDPRVDVRAITVSGTGLVNCEPGLRIVQGLIGVAAPGSSIPVVCGSEQPLAGDRAFPDAWRAQTDGAYGGVLPTADPPAPPDGGDAAQVIRAEAERADGSLVVLSLGPMTNLAQALTDDDQLAGRIDRVVAMGGAFTVPGNVELDTDPAAAVTEWNMYVDPTAAQRVLDADVPTSFVPIDSQVAIGPYLERALAESTSPVADLVSTLVESDGFFTSGAFFLWDPLAAAAVVRPSYLAERRADVVVQTAGEQAGRTTTVDSGGRPATIATLRETDAFLADLVRTLGGGGDVTYSRTPDLVADISTSGGCGLSTTSVPAGPTVIVLEQPSTALAIGTLDQGRTGADIDQFLLSGGVDPPPWFRTVGILMGGTGPVARYIDLPAGEHDAVCVVASQTAPTVGIETITAVASPA